MADSLILRKGLLASLAEAPKVAGAISITTDERAIYLDLSNTERIRIGDFIQVDKVSDLMATDGSGQENGPYKPWSTTAFYYAVQENALLKWTGSKWQQINEKSDFTSDIEALDDRVKTLETNVTGLTTWKTGTVDSALTDYGTRIGTLETNMGNKQDKTLDTANRVVITDASGNIDTSDIDTTKLGYLENVTSDIQTQINSTASGAATALDTAKKAITGTNDGSVPATLKVLNDNKADKSEVTALGNTLRGDNNTDTFATLRTDIDANAKAIEDETAARVKAVSDEASARGLAIQGIQEQINALDETYATDNQLTNAINTLKGEIEQQIQTADAMVYMGTIDSATKLPTTGVERGHTYKASANFIYDEGGVNETAIYVGDLLIAKVDQEGETYTGGWDHIASGYEDDHDVHIELKNDKVTVINAAGAERGNITFEGTYTEAKGGIQITLSENEKNITTGITDVKVSVDFQWGSF